VWSSTQTLTVGDAHFARRDSHTSVKLVEYVQLLAFGAMGDGLNIAVFLQKPSILFHPRSPYVKLL